MGTAEQRTKRIIYIKFAALALNVVDRIAAGFRRNLSRQQQKPAAPFDGLSG